MNDPSQTPWWRSANGLALCGFLLVAAFFLITEHGAHVFGALPYVLLLLCPLLHLFHHGRHGGQSPDNAGHGHHHGQQRDDATPPPRPGAPP